MADLSEQIERAASRPASVTTAGLQVEEPNLKDLVVADNHLCKKQVAAQPAAGIRFVKLVPPGMGGTSC